MNLREALIAALERFPVVTHVPGYGATEVFQPLNRPHSYHEETAWTVAHGAALAGTRAAALFKAHGFLKAANSLSTTLSAGTTAALVGLIFEDPQARHSDNVLQGAPVLRALGYEVFDRLDEAVAYSEQRSLPALVEVHDLEAPAGPLRLPDGPPPTGPRPAPTWSARCWPTNSSSACRPDARGKRPSRSGCPAGESAGWTATCLSWTPWPPPARPGSPEIQGCPPCLASSPTAW